MKEIFERRSIRTFKNQLVEPQKITMLLKAAMAAPSAGNQKAWEFFVVRNKIKLFRLSTCGPEAKCVKDAPFAIVACSTADAKYPELTAMDLSAAVENILLEATSLGLGAVWLAVAPYEERISEITKVLALPAGVTPFAMVAVGEPASLPKAIERYDPDKVHFVN